MTVLEHRLPPGTLAMPRHGPAVFVASGARHGVTVDMDSLYELIARHTLQLS